MKKEALKSAVWRFIRVAAAVVIAGVAVKYGKSDWYLVIAPVLTGIDKYIRG